MTRREWYERVNAAWPAQVPALTGEEAVRAFRRLYRYAYHRPPALPVQLTSGNRRTGRSGGAWHLNPERGWHDLVHVLSHYACPGAHGGAHARMELRLIKQVRRRGWLDGRLKAVPTPPPAPVDRRAQRYQRVLAAIRRWSAKQRRAARALAKLHRSRRAYEAHGLAAAPSAA